MSDHLPDGQERNFKTCRIRLNMNLVRQYEDLDIEKPTFSNILNELLADWLVTQKLKQEFAKLSQS